MKNFELVTSGLFLLSTASWAIQPQHVPAPEDPSTAPQFEVSGTGIGTLDFGKTAANSSSQIGSNFNDSSFTLGAAQRLYDGGGIGSFSLGMLSNEASVQGIASPVFLHQAFVDYQTEKFEALLGRSDNPAVHLVDFPTLRGDDLITLLSPLDPFSNGLNTEEHRYSNVASVTFNQELKFFENVHAQHLINSAGIGSDSAINSFGANFEYLSSPGMEAFQRIPFFGFGYEHLTPNPGASGGLHQIYAGGVLNLNESVTNRWDLRAEDNLSFGNRSTTFSTPSDTFEADSNSIAASLRYLDSPFGRPGYQLSLTSAYKTYLNVDHASSVGLTLTGVKRLGQGFDLVAQYLGQWRDSALASVQSGAVSFEQIGQIGFVFNFDTTFNQHIAPRRTLLNQLHHYVPE